MTRSPRQFASSRIPVGILLAVGLLTTLPGCQSQARHDVRSLVDMEEMELSRSPAVVRDPEVDGYLDQLGAMVLDAARELEQVPDDRDARSRPTLDVYDEFDVVLVHSTSLNAWVYGDDFTCVTSNLFLHADAPEEIVAVLCHEFAHLKEGHLVEAKEREYGHMFVGDLIEMAGGVADIAAMMYGIPVQVSGLTASAAHEHRQKFDPARPADEFEADTYGLRLYASMDLDPAIYDDLFERLVERFGDRGNGSHPELSERVERMHAAEAKLIASETDPHRRLDPEPMRIAQQRLGEVLTGRASANRLIAHEDVLRYRTRRGGRTAPQATSCGLLDVDAAELQEGFQTQLRYRP